MRILFILTMIALVWTPTKAFSVEIGDPFEGHLYAKKFCSDCHSVDARKEVWTSYEAPSFEAVANMQSTTRLSLIVWLQTTHPNMPNLIVPPEDTDNLIAYIMSLRHKK